MKIATWNLERVRPKSAQLIRDVIASIPADVWVLTETHADFALPEPYTPVASSFGAPDRTHGQQWVSI